MCAKSKGLRLGLWHVSLTPELPENLNFLSPNSSVLLKVVWPQARGLGAKSGEWSHLVQKPLKAPPLYLCLLCIFFLWFASTPLYWFSPPACMPSFSLWDLAAPPLCSVHLPHTLWNGSLSCSPASLLRTALHPRPPSVLQTPHLLPHRQPVPILSIQT